METQFNKAVITLLSIGYLTENNIYDKDILNAKVLYFSEAMDLWKRNLRVGKVKILNHYEYNSLILDRIEELKSKLIDIK